MPGPPPVPNEILRKRGTTGHKHRLSPVPVGQPMPRAKRGRPPTPPRPLGPAGMDVWKRVWRTGLDWITPASDVERVLTLCEIVDEYVALRGRVLAPLVGDDVPLTGGEKRTYDALRDLRKQYADAMNDLGFSPAARTRLSLGEVVPEDPLESFRSESA